MNNKLIKKNETIIDESDLLNFIEEQWEETGILGQIKITKISKKANLIKVECTTGIKEEK